jgi:hypothetical protein
MLRGIKNTSLAFLLTAIALTAAAANVDGDWNLSLTAPEGATYFKMTIAIDGETATGMVGEAAFSGTYRDGSLMLTGDYYVVEAGYNSTLNLDMRLEDDVLTGTATWDIYTADVLGKRPE